MCWGVAKLVELVGPTVEDGYAKVEVDFEETYVKRMATDYVEIDPYTGSFRTPVGGGKDRRCDEAVYPRGANVRRHESDVPMRRFVLGGGRKDFHVQEYDSQPHSEVDMGFDYSSLGNITGGVKVSEAKQVGCWGETELAGEVSLPCVCGVASMAVGAQDLDHGL